MFQQLQIQRVVVAREVFHVLAREFLRESSFEVRVVISARGKKSGFENKTIVHLFLSIQWTKP